TSGGSMCRCMHPEEKDNCDAREGGDMRKHLLTTVFLALGVPAMAQHGAHSAASQTQQRPMTDQEMIASAMSAAPKSVAEGATIIVMDTNNQARTLRQGTNGWSCMADSRVSPRH